MSLLDNLSNKTFLLGGSIKKVINLYFNFFSFICSVPCQSISKINFFPSLRFLITDDWIGREEYFIDGEDIVIYNDINDLNDKILYYLKNDKERERISNNGFKKVSKLTRNEWSKTIIEIMRRLD